MEREYKIVAINPGSTSTKVAAFANEEKLFEINVHHDAGEMARFKNVLEQRELRKADIERDLAEHGISLSQVDVIAARGGPRKGHFESGAYEVNEAMYNDCKDINEARHPSRLGPIIAYEWAQQYPNLKAYNYDTVFSDELCDLARVSGTPLCERKSTYHALNTRAVAREVAKKYGEDYFAVNYIMVHAGGGVSTSLHSCGRAIDVVAEDEGTFSPVRAGRVPRACILDLAYSGEYDKNGVKSLLDQRSGLVGYLGTNDCVEIEQRISAGDSKAEFVYDAFIYQLAKDVGELATVVCGKIDRIVITGGIAYSEKFCKALTERVSFIAPVEVFPGSIEQDALGRGILRVLRGEEAAKTYTSNS